MRPRLFTLLSSSSLLFRVTVDKTEISWSDFETSANKCPDQPENSNGHLASRKLTTSTNKVVQYLIKIYAEVQIYTEKVQTKRALTKGRKKEGLQGSISSRMSPLNTEHTKHVHSTITEREGEGEGEGREKEREKSLRSTEAGQSRCASYISNFSDGRVHTGGILPIWRATVLSGSAGRNSAYGGTGSYFCDPRLPRQLLR